jgi:hypothetical protein
VAVAVDMTLAVVLEVLVALVVVEQVALGRTALLARSTPEAAEVAAAAILQSLAAQAALALWSFVMRDRNEQQAAQLQLPGLTLCIRSQPLARSSSTNR